MSKLPVLLVEDNPDDERLARRALQALECVALDVARDGQEAIDLLSRSTPKLVLLDLKLPKIGGLDVLKWIRGHEESCGVPVVVFSSSSEVSDRIACERLHANSFIQKPVDFDRFLQVFRRTIEYWLTINMPSVRDGVDAATLCR